MRLSTCLAALALLGAPAFAQTTVHLNEIFASHAGTDDQEFIELIGTPNASLTGYMVLIVEGTGTVAGTLDRVYDLANVNMPSDGYLVIGGSAVSGVDVSVGTTNLFENDTETFYLVKTSNPASIAALLGKNVDSDSDLKTDIVGLATVVDIVAMIDGGTAPKVYDGAPTIGPDGTFFPPGIYRTGDYPGAWCKEVFLDFDDDANLAAPRTPGAKNVACIPAKSEAGGKSCLTGAGSPGGPSLSATEPVPGANWTVTATGTGSATIGFLFTGIAAVPPGTFLGCELYLAPSPLVLVGSLKFDTSGNATYSLTLPTSTVALLGSKATVQAAVGDPLYLTNRVDLQIGY